MYKKKKIINRKKIDVRPKLFPAFILRRTSILDCWSSKFTKKRFRKRRETSRFSVTVFDLSRWTLKKTKNSSEAKTRKKGREREKERDGLVQWEVDQSSGETTWVDHGRRSWNLEKTSILFEEGGLGVPPSPLPGGTTLGHDRPSSRWRELGREHCRTGVRDTRVLAAASRIRSSRGSVESAASSFSPVPSTLRRQLSSRAIFFAFFPLRRTDSRFQPWFQPSAIDFWWSFIVSSIRDSRYCWNVETKEREKRERNVMEIFGGSLMTMRRI